MNGQPGDGCRLTTQFVTWNVCAPGLTCENSQCKGAQEDIIADDDEDFLNESADGNLTNGTDDNNTTISDLEE